MTTDTFAIMRSGLKPDPYPMLLMFEAAHGIGEVQELFGFCCERAEALCADMAATRRATDAALERVRKQRAVTEAWYAGRVAA